MNDKLRKTVAAAVLCALTCAATLLIQIPTVTHGYVNPGDAIVLVCGWLLGTPWGIAAAGLGSALADIISGYVIYAPATLIIKGLTALTAALIFSASRRHALSARIMSAIAAELVMTLGYFVYEWLIITGSFETAVIGVPQNLFQGVIGLLGGIAVITALERTKAIEALKLNH